MQNLASKAGRTVPVTPLEGSVIGGNKDQAKMMGTRQSLQSTLRAPDPVNLQTRLRREQVRRDATAGEQKAIEEASQLQNLGSLGERVQALTSELINRGAQGAGASLSLTDIERDPELATALTELASAVPGSPEALSLTLAINQKLGRDQTNLVREDELRAEYKNITESVSGQAAQNIQDTVTVADIDLAQLGFSGPEELAEILGLDPVELEGETLSSLQQKIDAQLEEEYNRIDNLEQIANNPARSAAERAQARKELRAMGAVGVRTVESDIDELADQIEAADTVDYLGESYQIEDLLDDEVISGLAAKYLDDTGLASEEWKQQFREHNEELANWLEENKSALSESLAGIDETVIEFADIQDYNRNLITTNNGEQLPEEIADIVIPGYNELSAERLQGNIITDILKGDNQVDSANLTNGLKELYNYDPELVGELTSLSPDELKQFGITKDSEQYKQYLTHREDIRKLEDIPDTDYLGVFSELFGRQVTKPYQVQEELTELIRRHRSGLFGDGPAAEFIKDITDSSGRLLPLDQVSSNLKGKLTPTGIRQFLNNPSQAVSLSDKFSRVSGYNKAADSTGIFDKVKSAFDNDGKIDEYEYKKFNPADKAGILEHNFPVSPNAKRGLIYDYGLAYSRPEIKKTIDTEGILKPSQITRQTSPAEVDRALKRLKQLADGKEGYQKQAMELALRPYLAEIEKAFHRTRPKVGEGITATTTGYIPGVTEDKLSEGKSTAVTEGKTVEVNPNSLPPWITGA